MSICSPGCICGALYKRNLGGPRCPSPMIGCAQMKGAMGPGGMN
jgi:hypothetical protein